MSEINLPGVKSNKFIQKEAELKVEDDEVEEVK